MFAYIDPTIREQLIAEGKLISIDKQGRRVPSDGSSKEAFISMVGPVPLPVRWCEKCKPFRWYAWVHHSDLDRIEEVVRQVRKHGPKMLFALLTESMSVNSILIYGDIAKANSPLIRVHSNCLTGDVFGSQRCDCGPQLHETLRRIGEEGAGALVYMAGHEGRGIGLWAKAITYLLQDAGHDTYQANEKLGLPADSRDFSDAAIVLRYFCRDNTTIRLLSNNPMKREALEAGGFTIEQQQPLVTGITRYNVRYLTSKREHGHIIPAEALQNIRPAKTSDPT